MRKILLASAGLAALVVAAPLAAAQTTGGMEKKEAPAAMEHGGAHAQAEKTNAAQGAGSKPAMHEGAMRKAQEPAEKGAAAPSHQAQKPAETSPGKTGGGRQTAEEPRSEHGATKASEHGNARADERTGEAPKNAAQGQVGEKNAAQGQVGEKTNAAQTRPGENRHAAERSGEHDKASPQQATGAGREDQKTGAAENSASPNGPAGRSAAATSAAATTQAHLDRSQQQRLGDFVSHDRAARVEHPNFQVNVGVHVPEHVRVRRLPGEIASIVPEYRDDDYIVVNDEIVIIEPRTREIVTVLPAGEEGRGRVPAYHAHARLDRTQQTVVYKDVIGGARPIDRRMTVRVGERIPEDIELAPLPPVVIQNMPDLRDDRFFVLNQEVVLVDPDTREIVEIIRD